MTPEERAEVDDLRDWYMEQCRERSPHEVIVALESALERCASDPARLFIIASLAHQHELIDQWEEAESCIHDLIKLSNGAPEWWIRLAEFYHYSHRNLPAAARTIRTAVRRAQEEGSFVRQSLTTQIRIAISENDFPLVSRALRQLINAPVDLAKPDVWYETDFLDRIPAGTVEPDLLKRYRELAQTRRAPPPNAT
ncbi:MAG TPA: hypothetical protein VIF14_10610 [Alphaproteobacteria bacterium]|jgi:hypothetical protein